MKSIKDYITEKQEFPVKYDDKNRTIIVHPYLMSEWNGWIRKFNDIKRGDNRNQYITVTFDYLKNDIYADVYDEHFGYRVSREFNNYYVTDTKLTESELKVLPKNSPDMELEKDVKMLICLIFNSMPEPLFDN